MNRWRIVKATQMVASSIFHELFPIHTTVMAWCTKKMSCGRMMEDATKKMQV
jgi:hypothetical protein